VAVIRWIKVLIVIAKVREDAVAAPAFRAWCSMLEENAEIKDPLLGVQQKRLSGNGRAYRTDEGVAVTRITVEVVIECLKKKGPFSVLAKRDDIRLHDLFIIGVIRLEGMTIKANEADLCSQPQIPLLIEQEVIDAVLGKAIFVCKMLDRKAVDGIGLGHGRCYRQQKGNNNQKPDKLVSHALTLMG
jgi:hypothetical protein